MDFSAPRRFCAAFGAVFFMFSPETSLFFKHGEAVVASDERKEGGTVFGKAVLSGVLARLNAIGHGGICLGRNCFN